MSKTFLLSLLLLLSTSWVRAVNAAAMCTLCYGGGAPKYPNNVVDGGGYTCSGLAATAATFYASDVRCPNFQSFGFVSCGCPNHPTFPACPICSGNAPSNPNTVISGIFGSYSCSKLHLNKNTTNLIPSNYCPIVQQFAKSKCGCSSTATGGGGGGWQVVKKTSTP